MTLDTILDWVREDILPLVIGALVLFALYRLLEPLIPRVVTGLLQVQQVAVPGTDPADELRKRASTLELVLEKLLRAGVFLALVFLVLGVFDLWSLLAGVGLVAAAITLAGQQIVLDYLMGILILIEGPYFKGDWISVQGAGLNAEGEVEEIGLRRTTLRDGLGAVHSVSNGLIRSPANLTRVYSLATVEVQIVRPADLDRAIGVAGRVGRELPDHPDWGGQLFDSPVETWVTALTLDGATVRVQRRVPPSLRIAATEELRHRLAAAFAAESIGTGRWDTPPLAAAPVMEPSATTADDAPDATSA